MSPTLINDSQPSPARTRSQTHNVDLTLTKTSTSTQQQTNKTNNSNKTKHTILQQQQMKLNDLKPDLFPSPEKNCQKNRELTEHFQGQGRGRGQDNRKKNGPLRWQRQGIATHSLKPLLK